MRIRFFLGLMVIILLSCKNSSIKSGTVNINVEYNDTANNNTSLLEKESSPIDTAELAEFFVDSLNIGRPTYNKLEHSYYRTTDSFYVVINFYSKKGNKWVLKNHYELLKDGVLACDVNISDYTNDGFNDITYVSVIAARGANEVRTLLVYDKKTDRLVHIKNSDSYPNLQYNKKLNCIDAFLVYGGVYECVFES